MNKTIKEARALKKQELIEETKNSLLELMDLSAMDDDYETLFNKHVIPNVCDNTNEELMLFTDKHHRLFKIMEEIYKQKIISNSNEC